MQREREQELTVEYVRERAELFRDILAKWHLEVARGDQLRESDGPPFGHFRDLLSREAALLLRAKVAPPSEAADPCAQNLLHFIIQSSVEAACHPARTELRDQLATLKIPFGKEQLPLPRAASRIICEHRRIERSRADSARAALLSRLHPAAQRVLTCAHSVAELLEFSDYIAMWEETSGTSLGQVQELCRPVIEETEEAYAEMLQWFSRRILGVPNGRVQRHDLLHLFYGGPMEEFFPDRDLTSIGTATAGEMGIHLAALTNLCIEAGPGSTRSGRAYCAPLSIPARVILLAPRAEGLRAYRQFFHELGRALHFSHVGAEEPFETRALGDEAISESYGLLFEGLLDSPIWLECHLGLARQRDLIRFLVLERSFTFRRHVAKLAYEAALHRQSSLSGAADLYRDLMMTYTHAGFPKELYLLDADVDFRSARTLRAALFCAQLAVHFGTVLGEDWMRNPATGDELRALWRPGCRKPLAELAKATGWEGLSPRPCIDLVLERLG